MAGKREPMPKGETNLPVPPRGPGPRAAAIAPVSASVDVGLATAPAATADAVTPTATPATEPERGAVAESGEQLEATASEPVRAALHELRVHQIELEMQHEELRRAQQELAAARERYLELYELAPLGYVTVSEKGIVLRANLAAARLLGDDRAALVGAPISRFIHQPDQDAYYLCHTRLLDGRWADPARTSAAQTLELRLARPDGTQFWAGLVLSLAEEAGERLIHHVLSDVNERKAAEAALLERTRLLDLANDAIIIRDPDSRVVYWSKGAEATYGWPAVDAAGRVTHELLQTTFPVSLAATNAALESAGEWRGELGHTARDGRGLTVESRQSVERDARGGIRAVLEINRDITERRLADEARASLEAQLQQAQKMESIGRLAGGVAHDFNNMLGAILGNAELALEAIEPSHPVRADLLEIQAAARRSADLTRQLLAFARRQTFSPRVLDLNETLGGMLDMLRRLVLAGVELGWKPGLGLWPVSVDPSQLDQVLTNLVVNAGDAVGDTGTVTIETGNASLDAFDCADQPGAVPGEYVVLTVTDNGFGMDAATRRHLFEPFFTTKGIGKGTGLGLATVYGIVKQNEGFICVSSEVGTGSTFRVHLPRHQSQPVSSVEPTPRFASHGGGETILLVEDEPAILRLGTAMLERLEYRVISAATPGEAIRLAREHAGEIHLLMTDVVMPEMNGRDLARNLLSLYPRLGRLFMSGYTADVIADRGVLDPGVHFLQKPFSTNDLAAKVREALDQDPVSADLSAG